MSSTRNPFYMTSFLSNLQNNPAKCFYKNNDFNRSFYNIDTNGDGLADDSHDRNYYTEFNSKVQNNTHQPGYTLMLATSSTDENNNDISSEDSRNKRHYETLTTKNSPKNEDLIQTLKPPNNKNSNNSLKEAVTNGNKQFYLYHDAGSEVFNEEIKTSHDNDADLCHQTQNKDRISHKLFEKLEELCKENDKHGKYNQVCKSEIPDETNREKINEFTELNKENGSGIYAQNNETNYLDEHTVDKNKGLRLFNNSLSG